jgi:hypothetical protein
MSKLPPPLIGTARLLEYAIIDPSIVFTSRQLLYVDGKSLGSVPRLALCRDLSNQEIHLFHCDEEWTVLGISGRGSSIEVKEAAERSYQGLSEKWIAAPYSDDQVAHYLEEQWGGLRCSFCQNWPWEMQKLFPGPSIGICDNCIRSFHKALEKKN